jgi:nucleotide-binding universal stress UspA family protein
MLEKILVPLDTSKLAECALFHVVILAKAFGSQVTLLHVLDSERRHDEVQVDPLDWHLRKVEAQSYLDGVKEQFIQENMQPTCVLLEGPTADRIVEYARDQAFDLIILSSHGQSGLSGWNVSSVVQKVVLRANTSLMIVRAYEPYDQDPANIGYQRILCPLDGSQRAECVLPVATALAEYCEAEHHLVHVAARPQIIHRTPLTTKEVSLVEELAERNQLEAFRYFSQLQTHLGEDVQTHVMASENIAVQLHELAEQKSVDLVLLSAHGYSCEKKWPYGSVVASFLSYGVAPLLIIQDLSPQELQPTSAEKAIQAMESGQGRDIINAGHSNQFSAFI